uniref:Myosin heavy chain-related protein n=1 Tax=Tanacetum cinerariifolium TaxID=118510 RepID=A0A6L2NLM9_TANCI|nr:myosin heavy chain-related protein [Tanacetum cinerariifolium]
MFFELLFIESDGSDQDARYTLSKLLQRGTVAEYETRATEARFAKDALSKLLQKGTVAEYQNAFEMLISQVTSESEFLLTTIYISGLKVATTLREAFSLACIIEAPFEVIVHEEKATAEKEQSIKETTDTITSLQSEVASLKAKGSLDANKEIKNDHTLVHEFKKREEKLSMELHLKNNFREALETTSNDLGKTILDLNPTLHDLQKVVVDQKKNNYETTHALNIVDEEFKKAKSEATTKIRKLAKVYGAWLPPWLTTHLVVYQPYVNNQSKNSCLFKEEYGISESRFF